MVENKLNGNKCIALEREAAESVNRKVAVLQSNYIPWKGYFDLIHRVDHFVLLDEVQYTKNDWRNRNRIKTPHGAKWLTIPVEFKYSSRQSIADTVVAGHHWRRKHWTNLLSNYNRSPHFALYCDELEEAYLGSRRVYLSEINCSFLRMACRWLGIHTPILNSLDYQLRVGKSDRLVDLCLKLGASEYLSGPAARNYLDERLFVEAGIKVSWMDYSGYPEYPQFHPPFEHAVTVLDILFHLGPHAPEFIWDWRRSVPCSETSRPAMVSRGHE